MYPASSQWGEETIRASSGRNFEPPNLVSESYSGACDIFIEQGLVWGNLPIERANSNQRQRPEKRSRIATNRQWREAFTDTFQETGDRRQETGDRRQESSLVERL